MHSLLLILSFFLVAADAPTSAPRLIAFTGVGCRPCREMRPIVLRLERSGVRVERIDASDEKATRRLRLREPITGVPTYVAMRGDRECGRIRGKTTFERLRRLLCRDDGTVLVTKPDSLPKNIEPEAKEPTPAAPTK